MPYCKLWAQCSFSSKHKNFVNFLAKMVLGRKVQADPWCVGKQRNVSF